MSQLPVPQPQPIAAPYPILPQHMTLQFVQASQKPSLSVLSHFFFRGNVEGFCPNGTSIFQMALAVPSSANYLHSLVFIHPSGQGYLWDQVEKEAITAQ